MNPAAYQEMADTEARHWWFMGRRAILASAIAQLRLPPQPRILEIGSGTGGNLAMLSRFGHLSALEPDATARAIAKQKTTGRVDIRAGHFPADLPFAEQTFDLVCLFDVLEHIEKDVDALAAARHLLTPGGRILITVPACRWLWGAHDLFLHHKRRYTAPELRDKISRAGLCCEKISGFNTLLFPLAAGARLADRFFGSPVASGTKIPPAPLNTILFKIFAAERYILKKLSLPFGVSLFAVLRAEEECPC